MQGWTQTDSAGLGVLRFLGAQTGSEGFEACLDGVQIGSQDPKAVYMGSDTSPEHNHIGSIGPKKGTEGRESLLSLKLGFLDPM